ncbi:hypothetical protein C7M84_025089 [Penaeus vannamei]|uniref:Uncharacterized protein n=1 Tax=Penaeus vannamei TaxID=6689 RepID=A0A3R7QXD8_PENVA|nr:hypothetical protein C7M84_025089 [Penaeus vannamei]
MCSSSRLNTVVNDPVTMNLLSLLSSPSPLPSFLLSPTSFSSSSLSSYPYFLFFFLSLPPSSLLFSYLPPFFFPSPYFLFFSLPFPPSSFLQFLPPALLPSFPPTTSLYLFSTFFYSPYLSFSLLSPLPLSSPSSSFLLLSLFFFFFFFSSSSFFFFFFSPPPPLSLTHSSLSTSDRPPINTAPSLPSSPLQHLPPYTTILPPSITFIPPFSTFLSFPPPPSSSSPHPLPPSTTLLLHHPSSPPSSLQHPLSFPPPPVPPSRLRVPFPLPPPQPPVPPAPPTPSGLKILHLLRSSLHSLESIKPPPPLSPFLRGLSLPLYCLTCPSPLATSERRVPPLTVSSFTSPCESPPSTPLRGSLSLDTFLSPSLPQYPLREPFFSLSFSPPTPFARALFLPLPLSPNTLRDSPLAPSLPRGRLWQLSRRHSPSALLARH